MTICSNSEHRPPPLQHNTPAHPVCPKCGYNLTGLQSSQAALCPECGHLISTSEKSISP